MQTNQGQKLTTISLTLRAEFRQTLEAVLGVHVKFYSSVKFRQANNGYYALVDYYCEELDADKAQASVMDSISIEGLEAHDVEFEDMPYVAG